MAQALALPRCTEVSAREELQKEQIWLKGTNQNAEWRAAPDPHPGKEESAGGMKYWSTVI